MDVALRANILPYTSYLLLKGTATTDIISGIFVTGKRGSMALEIPILQSTHICHLNKIFNHNLLIFFPVNVFFSELLNDALLFNKHTGEGYP